MKTFIGIDPGKHGGLVVLDGDLIASFVMPLIGKAIDVKRLNRIIAECSESECYCVLEDVHALFGSSAGSTFDFGYGLGLIEGILTANEVPYSKIAPKKWQSQMFEGIPMMTKPSSTGKTTKTDTKPMALIAVQRMFPTMNLLETPRCKKPHEGIVDAALMAEYCRRNFK